MAKITKASVDKLNPGEMRPVFLWDDRLAGFGVKCLPTGVKRYIVKYRTSGGGRNARQRWLTLGSHGQLTPDQAFKLAQQALAAVARGEDPQGEKAESRVIQTVADLWVRFDNEVLAHRKPKTRHDYGALWKRVLAPRLGKVPVRQVARKDIEGVHNAHRQTPYQANRALAVFSKMMNLAEAWELRPTGSNPCRHVQRYAEKPRNRYLNAEELQAIGRAMFDLQERRQLSDSAANAIRLLLFTGARLNEMLGCKWEWVDTDRNVIRLPDSKTGAKLVFLSEAATAVLENQRSLTGHEAYVFAGPGAKGHMVNLTKPWARVCALAGISEVRLHDLRHTAASVAVGQGMSLPVIGRLLGHTQAQTTQRYAHVDIDPALKAANLVAGSISMSLGKGIPQK